MRKIPTASIGQLLLMGLVACGGSISEEGRKVDASGKEVTELGAVPAEILVVASAAQPDLTITQVEYETRDGNEYYDVGGTLSDGSELELDMTKIDGLWTVVETQQDVNMGSLPIGVGDVLTSNLPEWQPDRIIESDQGDGIFVYEFFGQDEAGQSKKVEIKWADGQAEFLADEWVH